MDNNYDYNPVTDRFIKVSDSKPLSVEEKTAYDNMERRAREHAESLRQQQAKRDINFVLDMESSKIKKEFDSKYEAEKEQNREAYINEIEAKREAVKKAYERYKSKNPFYRVFHKSVYKMNPYKDMSVDEINSLYGGRSI